MLLEILFAILAIFITLVSTTWFFHFISTYVYLKTIPSPKLWPIIGNALEVKNPEELLTTMPILMKKLNSKTIRLHVGMQTVLLTVDVKLFEMILTSPAYTHKDYFCVEPWLGNGIGTAKVGRWKKTRRLIIPSFHFKMLDNFVNVFNSNGLVMINKLRKQVNNPNLDISSYMSLCTLDIICEAAMGIYLNLQSNETSEYVHSIHEITNIVLRRMITPWYHYDIIYKCSQLYREQEKHIKIMNSHTNKVINMRRQQLLEEARQNDTVSHEDEFGRKKKFAFLDQLLKGTIDGKPFSDKELEYEVSTIMFAGHDTTACAMSFILYLLANHPHIQQKVFEEVSDIFGADKDRLCTLADTNEMIYLEMVIKESLRLYPPAPIFVRRLLEDCVFEGVVIPKGVEIIFFAYGIQRDSDYYANPEVFDPDRYSPENQNASSKLPFYAFSAGPRNCIGQKFGIVKLKVLTSLILRHFELIPAVPKHEAEVRLSMVLKCTNGINLGLVERK